LRKGNDFLGENEPAGWFMKDESREVAAEDAAPDMMDWGRLVRVDGVSNKYEMRPGMSPKVYGISIWKVAQNDNNIDLICAVFLDGQPGQKWPCNHRKPILHRIWQK
jgi:hypothetical protein